MRYLLLLVCVLFISCGNDAKREPISEEKEMVTTTYYLIRHAEKDRTTADDPALTIIGRKRADHWANHFRNINLDAVYSTDYNRTKETAAPTAKKKGITTQLYDPAHLFDDAFKEATFGKTVLVVGHSNTTPAFVNTIIGEQKYPQISDTENGMLYQVTLQEDGTSEVLIEKVPFN